MEENHIKEVMGTSDKTSDKTSNNQRATSARRFEDSPSNSMFNSLSPIRPVIPMHITQTINPLTFGSFQSEFASLKESRVIHRHQFSDPLRPEFSSDYWNMVNKNKANVDADNKLDDYRVGNLDPTAPASHELSELIAQLSRNNPKHEPEYGTNLYQTSDLDDLVSNSSDLSVDPGTSFYMGITHTIQNKLSCGAFGNSFTNPREERESNDKLGMNGGSSITNPCQNMDYPHHSGLYRGVRQQRCLGFDKTGPPIKHLADNSTSHSRMQENDSSQCTLPAATPSDYNKDSSLTKRSFHHPPASSGQELVCTTLTDNGVARVEDSCWELRYMENEGVNPSSPNNKRRRLEQAGEGEGSLKRCNCIKSKCLKLYCECFAAGAYCVEPCACIDCFNKADHEEIVLSSRTEIESRNPLAFAPKVIRSSDSSLEVADDISKTPASARHKRGCNCKKSDCLKKYCECYKAGVGCSINCRCEGCKNEYGTKDGSCALIVDHELEEDATPLRQMADDQSFEKSSYFNLTPRFSRFSEFLIEGSLNSSNYMHT